MTRIVAFGQFAGQPPPGWRVATADFSGRLIFGQSGRIAIVNWTTGVDRSADDEECWAPKVSVSVWRTGLRVAVGQDIMKNAAGIGEVLTVTTSTSQVVMPICSLYSTCRSF
jgi:hypothetical protein